MNMPTSQPMQQVAQNSLPQAKQKPARKPKSALRQLTEKLDKQVKKVEAKKAQIEKLQASLAEDQKEMQALLSQIANVR